MWNWFPWKWVLRKIARAQGFMDPMRVVAQLQRFAQPSEVAAPIELLRLSSVLQVRGLINAQAIQHNLDWIWPFWVEKQFNPRDAAFVPRAFSMTHINLTHRNWTAVGIPEVKELPIIDPHGCMTPHYDSWSIDCWIYENSKEHLTPSRHPGVRQKLLFEKGLSVETHAEKNGKVLKVLTWVENIKGIPHACLKAVGASQANAKLVISLRPMNPEGVSFIHHIGWSAEKSEWKVNKKQRIYLDQKPDQIYFSHYREGDVFLKLGKEPSGKNAVECNIGMATSAAAYAIKAGSTAEAELKIPLKEEGFPKPLKGGFAASGTPWQDRMNGLCELKCPDEKSQFLYDAALRTLILHAPGKEVYPGPYTYKHFWFRDAAFILEAMLSVGFTKKVETVIDSFASRQTPFGHFLSQDGEWDSNGEALWIYDRYCELTQTKPKESWQHAIKKGTTWLSKKRLSEKLDKLHAGLLPAGFSAEHLGPNDYYYWDNFWGVKGLRSAAKLFRLMGGEKRAEELEREANSFMRAIEKSLEYPKTKLGTKAMPSSPYRRLDTGSIGSIAVGYPLQLWEARDERLMATLEYLLDSCMINDGFFHDMSHSGVNAYLTLAMAQVLLRAGDMRYQTLMRAIKDLASPTGQWPEAIHPATRGGCMGDGQHVWAAAEWVLMVRNCFVLEEEDHLILGAGILPEWLKKGEALSFGPVRTKFGYVEVHIDCSEEKPRLKWKGDWFREQPMLYDRLGESA